MTAITHAELTTLGPDLGIVMGEYLPRATLRRDVPFQTPLDWNGIGHAHITDTWAHLGDCIGAIIAYMANDIGVPAPDIEMMVGSEGIYFSSFLDAGEEHNFATTGQSFDPTWWGGDPFNKANWTLANLEAIFGFSGTFATAAATGTYVASGGGGGAPPGPSPGSGPTLSQFPSYLESQHGDLPTDVTSLNPPSKTVSQMGGFTSYNAIKGHFFLKKMPDPITETVNRTVQGFADSFESKYEDISVKSLVGQNDRVDVTEIVYQGEITQAITESTISTFAATGSGAKTGAVVISGGSTVTDPTFGTLSNVSGHDDIIAIRVEDVRPFALKGLDLDHEALWDWNNPKKATNKNYIRHLTPVKRPRIAKISFNGSDHTLPVGFPSVVEIHYSAIDKTGQVMAGLSNWVGTLPASSQNGANDFAGMQADADFTQLVTTSDWPTNNTGWLVVEKTVPHASQVYLDANGVAVTLADVLKRPTNSNTYTPIKIQAPGGLVSLPTKSVKRKIGSHTLQTNPTGDITGSSFCNLEFTPRMRMLNATNAPTISLMAASNSPAFAPYGIPVAMAGTRTPVKESEGAFHTLSITHQAKAKDLESTQDRASQQPVSFEQFDVIDNLLKSDRHLILIHPKDRSRSGTLASLKTPIDSQNDSHMATLELNLMRGRAEEIVPTTGEDGDGSGLAIRGRSQMVEISDSQVKEDFDLGKGHPVKEIGDLGSPVVSLTMGGLGQGGMDVAASRTEHSFLPIWKDRVIGTGNPSVRNDRQTSTYTASTRALVEIPLFPSMFYDIEKRLETSQTKRTPLPADQSMEMIVDCTMTATNRPHMQQYESRYSIDWGLKNQISMLRIHNFDEYSRLTSPPPLVIRCMRENASTFTRSATHSTSEDTVVDAGNAYIEVDSVLPFVLEGGKSELAAPTGGNQTWNMSSTHASAPYDQPVGKGFIVTVGEGILSPMGIRLFIWKMEINGDSHRLYFTRFHNPLNETMAVADMKHYLVNGLSVVMGGWLRTDAYFGNATATELSGLQVSGGSATALAQSFGEKIELLLGRRGIGVTTTSVCLDPNDDSGATILINDGPTMEGLQFDPGFELYGSDDIPLKPFVECMTGYLANKGKKRDSNSLEYVRPLHLKFGALAQDNFDSSVQEVIRRINQAATPLAKNSNGGSVFDPPALFTGAVGTFQVSSSDTGTHMGYVRAFEGSSVESKTGEKGTTIVIHSTIPGATSRNFAIWFNNNGLYPYQPTQTVGHGGLLATNSRSYQASSFAAPLPLGMDGETHVPITTFRGGVHGAVEWNDELRTYNGIGSALEFTSVRMPRDSDDELLRLYDGDTQNRLWVQRKVLDTISRGRRQTDWNAPGRLLIDGKFLATYDYIDSESGYNFSLRCKDSGVGACCALVNVQPIDPTKKKKLVDLFVADDGKQDAVDIVLLDPLIDANGILFFGGGHTGVTFDVSDGTDNDYSDFYTHHYAKGPTGYSGHQNLQEIQTSAAVLDFTEIRNEDTAKTNSVQGIHYNNDNCIFYLRMNDDRLYTTDYNQNGAYFKPTWLPIENKYGLPVGLVGNFSQSIGTMAQIDKKPLYLSASNTGDVSAKGMSFADQTFAGIVLHEIYNYNLQDVRLPAQFYSSMVASGPWSFSCFVKPHDPTNASWGALNNSGFGGPVFHMIDRFGYPLGVSILTRQHDLLSGASNNYYNIKVVVHHRDSASGTVIQTTFSTNSSLVLKDSWCHVAVSKPTNADPIIYINGVVINPVTTAPDENHPALANYLDINDASYRTGTNQHPRLMQQVGVGFNNPAEYTDGTVIDFTTQSNKYTGRLEHMATIGIALHGCPVVGGNQLTAAASFGGGTGDYNYGYVNGGGSGAGVSIPTYFKGRLAEIGIFKAALEASDITAINNRSWD